MKSRLVTWTIVLCLLSSVSIAVGQGSDVVVQGTIDDATPFVRVPITIPSDGSTLLADIVHTSGDLDTVLYVVDSEDQIVAENDDRAKGETDSRLIFPEADSGGLCHHRHTLQSRRRGQQWRLRTPRRNTAAGKSS